MVTDRAVLAICGDHAVHGNRDVLFGKPTGVYHRIQLDRTYRVHRQYYDEVAAADTALRQLHAREED